MLPVVDQEDGPSLPIEQAHPGSEGKKRKYEDICNKESTTEVTTVSHDDPFVPTDSEDGGQPSFMRRVMSFFRPPQ